MSKLVKDMTAEELSAARAARRDQMRRWRASNPEKWRSIQAKFYARNRTQVREQQRQYAAATRDKKANYMRKYRAENRKRVVESNWRCVRRRLSLDPAYRLLRALRVRLCAAVRGTYRSGSAVRDLGMPVAEFKARLEAQFLPGMAWENWGKGEGKWQIDHFFPLAAADLSDRAQLLAVCNYRNLQPLWFADNVAKGDSVSPEAQALFEELVLLFRKKGE
jgi:hypothetical protein